jgi:diaminopimelate decarboxylase
MDHFRYQAGTLHAEDVAVPEIAATPFYVHSTATLSRHYRPFTKVLTPLPGCANC